MPILALADLHDRVAAVFDAVGLEREAAATLASALIDGDRRGISSHGVMLVPMYVDRIREGSVSADQEITVVADHGAVATLDAQHAFGVFTGDRAMRLAVDKARTFGVGAVAVRHAFHFGGAYRYAQAAAAEGLIGLAAANTRPLMPAVGGAEAVVGNNPLAIAAPRADGPPVVLDMAMSAAALGKIRLAAQEGRSIPAEWATDAAGNPTTDPAEAIDGLLLPAAGPKGFGLAFMLDVLTGVLSGGAFGNAVRGLYADTSLPNDCAHVFVAIAPWAFGCGDFPQRVDQLSREVQSSDRTSGTDRLLLPGQMETERSEATAEVGVHIDEGTLAELDALSAELGLGNTTEEASDEP